MGTSRKQLLLVLGVLHAFGSGACHDGPGGLRATAEKARGVADADPEAAASPAGGALVERAAAAATEDAGLPPLEAAGALVSLAVPGFADAVVSVPVGARTRRPVMLAVHGNYDSPDFHCGLWRSMVQERGFILCPRGVARRDSPGPDDIRFTYGAKFGAELDAAIVALRERFGAWVDPGPMVYIGFSLGAILARSYVSRAPSRFDRLILIEGGASGWDARAMRRAGTARMLWGCGQAPCADAARASAASFERAEVRSKVVYAKAAGHTYGGPVAELVRAEWEWLVADDPRWSP